MSATYIDELDLPTEGKVVVDFGASWCLPCEKMDPIVDGVAGDTVSVVKVDITENQDVAVAANVRSIPTFILVEDGVEVDRLVGATSSEHFNKFVNGDV